MSSHCRIVLFLSVDEALVERTTLGLLLTHSIALSALGLVGDAFSLNPDSYEKAPDVVD